MLSDGNKMLNYKLIDIGLNIKATIYCIDIPIITFNCHTKYEESAIEMVGRVMAKMLKPMIEEAAQEVGCQIHEDIEEED